MSRKKMNPKRDRKVYSHTAVTGKKVNVNPRTGRGGNWF